MKTSIMRPEFIECLLWKITADHPNMFVLDTYPQDTAHIFVSAPVVHAGLDTAGLKEEKDTIPPHSVL